MTFYEEALALKRQPGVAGRASWMGNDSEMMGHHIFIYIYIYDPRWVIRCNQELLRSHILTWKLHQSPFLVAR